MNDFNQNQANYNAGTRSSVQYDAGLRSYMLGIYNYMAIALAITGIFAAGGAYLASTNQAVAYALYAGPLSYVIFFAPLAFVLVLSFGIHKLSTPVAKAIFWAYSAVMGLSLSAIFFTYEIGSIAQIFFVTAASFGCLSLFGYTTKRNLSGMGSFLMMGLFGLIIAGIVKIYISSEAFNFAYAVIGVLIFAGLTAYDTQRLKHQYDMVSGHTELMARATIMGALSLYLNFINMFMFLLQLFGNSND